MSDDKTAELTRAIETLRGRRTVLRGAAVAGMAGICTPLLAACGGSDDAGGTTSAPTSAPSSTASGTPSSGGAGAVLGPVSDIPVGGGKIFADAKVVVTQPTAGQFKGYSAVCTHQGNPVRSIADGTIRCPTHGSQFNITDGSVAKGPASRPLPAVNVAVEGTNIVQSA